MILQYITGELQPFAVHHYNKALYFYIVYCESNVQVDNNLLWIYNVYCGSHAKIVQ